MVWEGVMFIFFGEGGEIIRQSKNKLERCAKEIGKCCYLYDLVEHAHDTQTVASHHAPTSRSDVTVCTAGCCAT